MASGFCAPDVVVLPLAPPQGRQRRGAGVHSDDSADSVELPPGMISESPGYPRSIDADLKHADRVAKNSYSCDPFAAIPGRDNGELPDHMCHVLPYRIASELSGVSAGSPSFTMTGGPPSRRLEPQFVMTKIRGTGGLLLCKWRSAGRHGTLTGRAQTSAHKKTAFPEGQTRFHGLCGTTTDE